MFFPVYFGILPGKFNTKQFCTMNILIQLFEVMHAFENIRINVWLFGNANYFLKIMASKHA